MEVKERACKTVGDRPCCDKYNSRPCYDDGVHLPTTG